MELIAYLSLMSLAIIIVFLESKLLLKFLLFPACIIYLAIVRHVGFDVDINTYASSMMGFIPTSYYNREFIYWYSALGIYLLTESTYVSFLLMDVFWICIVYRVAKNIKNNDKERFSLGFFAILIVSFPLFFGYQNIYRQHLAGLLFLLSYSLLTKSQLKGWVLFFFTIFVHNSVLLLLPLMISQKIFNIQHRYRRILAIMSSLVIIVLLNFRGSYSSVEYSTGLRMELVYFLLFFITFCVYLFKFNMNLNTILLKMPSLVISIVLIGGLLLMGHSLVAERIGLFLVILLIYELYCYSGTINKYIRRSFFRIALLLTFSLPILFFSSSFSFFDAVVAGH